MGPPADTGLQHSPSNFSISWPLRLAICLMLATGLGAALFFFTPLGLWVWPTAKPHTIFDELNEKPGGEFIPQNPGYLGLNSCAPCHAKRVDDFHGTRHFRCRPARAGIGPKNTSRPKLGATVPIQAQIVAKPVVADPKGATGF